MSNPDAYDKIEKLFWLFTQMGNLVRRGHITVRDVGNLMGSTPVALWRKYGTVIEGLRANYYSTKSGHASFEYLAKTMMNRIESGAWGIYVEEMRQAIQDTEIR